MDLEDFWMELAESSYTSIPDIITFDYDDNTRQSKLKTVPSASLNAAVYGVPKLFLQRWLEINNFIDNRKSVPRTTKDSLELDVYL